MCLVKAHFCDKEQISLLEDKVWTEQFNGLLETEKKAVILGGLWLLFNSILKIRGNRDNKDKKMKQYENVEVILIYCNEGIARF